MPIASKMEAVNTLEEIFHSSPVIIVAEYKGLDVATIQAMRRTFSSSGIQFKIAKNTLARIAADRTEKPYLKEMMNGAIGFFTIPKDADPALATKVIIGYKKEKRLDFLQLKGGYLQNRTLSPQQIEDFSNLPPREVLIAQILSLLNAPATRLTRALVWPQRGLVTILERYKEKQG